MGRSKDGLFLFLGDLLFFALALWLAISARNLEVAGFSQYLEHIKPFSALFLLWALVFLVFDLYSKQTLILKHKLAGTILSAQITNTIIAVLFFYFIPVFDITPRTIMVLDLVFSSVLIFLWRLYVINIIYRGRLERAVLIGGGLAVEELRREIEANPHYNLEIIGGGEKLPGDPAELLEFVKKFGISMIILNLHEPGLKSLGPELSQLLSSQVKFIDLEILYEEIFERVPISLVNDAWFLEYVSSRPKRPYTILKRFLDIVVSLIFGLISLPLYPLIILAIKLDDAGEIFITQERIGRGGQIIKLTKFRTMRESVMDKPTVAADPRITRVGKYLRQLRLDELPQLWNVLEGRISLVGPRPELPFFAEKYRKEISYYDLRHLVQPGMAGWALLRYHEPAYSAATNAEKLAYDLYYLKNRSFILDLTILLKTFRYVLLRKGI